MILDRPRFDDRSGHFYDTTTSPFHWESVLEKRYGIPYDNTVPPQRRPDFIQLDNSLYLV
jgi:hypothetical protein